MSDSYVSAGTVFDIVVNGGSSLYVLSSGNVVSSNVESAGALYAYAGGVADNSTIQGGGFFEVASGGFAETSDISASGFLDVAYSGYANSTSVLSGGEAYVGSGGFVFNTNLEGLMVVSGISSLTTVRSGGVELLYGYDLEATVDNGGLLLVASSGIASDAVVSSGGNLVIDPGGSATSEVDSGGFVVAGPQSTFSAFGIMSGGALIDAGGSDVSLATNLGGEVISSGVAVHDTATNSLSTVSGLIGTTVGDFNNAFVLAGGYISNGLVDSLASVTVYSGGRAVGNSVEGFITAYSGATVSDTSLSGGTAYVFSGATFSATTVAGGAVVVSGGTIYNTTLGGGSGDSPGQLYLIGGETSGTVLQNGGTEYVFQGLAVATTVESGATLNVGGYASGLNGFVLGSDDTTIMSGGLEYLVDGAVGSNTTIEGGLLSLRPFNPDQQYTDGIATGMLDFVGGGGQALIDTADLSQITVSGFGLGDEIVIDDEPGGNQSATVLTPGTVTLNFGTSSYELAVIGATSNSHFLLNEDVLTLGAPCFAAGTRILTPRGEVAVEELAVGDMVITRSGDDAAILWIGHRRIDLARHPRPEQVRPIRIAADSLGEGVPRRDLLLSPDHALFIGGVLIPAKALLNDRNIRQLKPNAVTYFHIELAEHDIIFAENCAVETYLETGNRGAFANATGAVTLHPDFAQTLREQKSCAPFTESGPVVEDARERTMRRHYEMRVAAGR